MSRVKTSRMVYGVSDWPEEMGKEFAIVLVYEGESDADAIERARSYYSPELQCVIREEGAQS